MMKKLMVLALCAGAALTANAQPSVGLSIGINQPGVYGRINIGDFPQPRVVYEQPVVIAPAPIAVPQQPIYLYVPPMHQQYWSRYCGRYSACGQPVYFVHEDWMRERWEERRRWEEHHRWEERHEHGWDRDRDHDRGHGHDHDRDGRHG